MDQEKTPVPKTEDDKGFSRRSFLTGAAAVGAVAAAGTLAACQPTGNAGGGDTPAANGGAEQPAAGAWNEKPASVADQVSATEDWDVVVVGAGNAGLFG